MLKHIKIKLAGLNIDIEYLSDRIAGLCRNYAADFSVPDIKVRYDKAGCEKEASAGRFSAAAAEFSNIYRQIAEALPRFSGAVTHGATVSYKGNAYMFIAKSGTGKTTHINLWRQYFDGVGVINGDKPILRVSDKVLAYGTPWAGKERLENNTSAPLGGICVIKRAEKNSIRRLEPQEALTAIIKQVYMPADPAALDLTVKIFDDIIRLVPFYELSCNISREAAELSFNTLTGKKI